MKRLSATKSISLILSTSIIWANIAKYNCETFVSHKVNIIDIINIYYPGKYSRRKFSISDKYYAKNQCTILGGLTTHSLCLARHDIYTHQTCFKSINPYHANSNYLNFHPLEVVFRYREPQHQAAENYCLIWAQLFAWFEIHRTCCLIILLWPIATRPFRLKIGQLHCKT